MSTETNLPDLDAAREVLGLSFEEVAKSLRVNYTTFYRWRRGTTRNPKLLDQLEQLGELAGAIAQSLRREVISEWLVTPASVFEGRTPREMILAGRTETVLGALLSYQHIYSALADLEEPTAKSSLLAEERGDLPLRTRAALAMLDADIDSLLARMQTAESKRARHKALATRPRVRLD